jgi:hypothetical protein
MTPKKYFTQDEQLSALERAISRADLIDASVLASIIVRLTPPSSELPTVAELSAISASAGKGAKRVRLEAWGVPWPPPRGWLVRLLHEAREREAESTKVEA